MLKELGDFGEAQLALIELAGGGVGMLVPDKGQQRVQ